MEDNADKICTRLTPDNEHGRSSRKSELKLEKIYDFCVHRKFLSSTVFVQLVINCRHQRSTNLHRWHLETGNALISFLSSDRSVAVYPRSLRE